MRKVAKGCDASGFNPRFALWLFLNRAKETNIEPPARCDNPDCPGAASDGKLLTCSSCKVCLARDCAAFAWVLPGNWQSGNWLSMTMYT